MEECTSVGRAVKDWERFTDEVTRVIDKKPDLVVFVLWGRSPSERRS
jgi:uracil DNA glycosylase